MLILTRRPGEAICIGDDIEILIKEVRRNHVRIGINAPKDVQIRRADTVTSDPKSGDTEAKAEAKTETEAETETETETEPTETTESTESDPSDNSENS